MDAQTQLRILAESCKAIVAHPYLRAVRIEREIGRRGRYSLRVAFNSELIVRVPYLFREEDVLGMVKRHRRYILNRLRERPVVPFYEAGERISLFGKEYMIAFRSGNFFLEGEETIACGKDVKNWLYNELRTKGEGFLSAYARTMSGVCGVQCPQVRVSRSKSIWGCCRHEEGRDVIFFRLSACLLPERLLRYLAVHELCHLKQRNHSPAFWAEVAKVLPDYKRLNKELDDYLAEDYNERLGVFW